MLNFQSLNLENFKWDPMILFSGKLHEKLYFSLMPFFKVPLLVSTALEAHAVVKFSLDLLKMGPFPDFRYNTD